MAAIKGINSVFVYVSDMDRSRGFYEHVLGLDAPVVTTSEWVEYDVGTGTRFALHGVDADRFAGVEPGRSTVRFSFEVDDIEGMAARVRDAGIAIGAESTRVHGFRFYEFADPDGNPLRLLEWA